MPADWYYLDGSVWTPFDSTISSGLEAIFQSGSASGQLSDFTADFHSMSLKRRNKRNRILIKRADMNANPSFAWEWELNGQWNPYDFFDSDFLCQVESKPHLQKTVLYLGPENIPFEIDTRAGNQRNMKTSYRRSIRKVSIGLPPPPSSTSVPTMIAAAAPLASSALAPPPLSSSLPSATATSPSAVTAQPQPSSAVAASAVDLSNVSPHIRGVILACIKFDCNEDCVICMEPFDATNGAAHSLPDCLNHGFHLECIKNQLQSQGKCPICNKIYIVNEGTQPKNGTMSVRTNGRSLPGYPRCGTIEMSVSSSPPLLLLSLLGSFSTQQLQFPEWDTRS
jgi:hypothetical protein